MPDRDELPDDVLAALPIFPLPNCVLLPHGLLPLHIFEPRYRAMTRDALDGSGIFAMARLRMGIDPQRYGQPMIDTKGCAARIIASEALPDGRFMLVLHGIARVAFGEELPLAQGGYRRVRAHRLPDRAEVPPTLTEPGYRQLVSLCDHLATVLDRGGAQLRELVRSDRHPGICADAVAAALSADVSERQHLLETLCPVDRVAQTIAIVGRLLCELSPCDQTAN